jgi:hypothetical protein
MHINPNGNISARLDQVVGANNAKEVSCLRTGVSGIIWVYVQPGRGLALDDGRIAYAPARAPLEVDDRATR